MILKISWTDKVTNKEVLVCVNEARSILKIIWHMKYRWLGTLSGLRTLSMTK